MAENSLQKHSEDLTTISKGQSRPCLTPKLVSSVYGYAQIYTYTMPSARTLFERVPLISAAKLRFGENFADVMTSTRKISKIGKILLNLGKHKLRPEKLWKLNSLKNSKKQKNLKNFATLPRIASGNLSRECCSILPWQKATKNAFGTGFLNLHLNHFMHWCSCQSCMF